MRTAFILVSCFFMIYSSCKEERKQPVNAIQQSPGSNASDNRPNISVPSNMTPVSGPPVTNHPPQNPKGIWHFTCPKGCPGGAGEAVPCSGCGITLVHNQAYHQ